MVNKRERDAGTGRFVPDGTGKKKPKTTITETIKPKKKKK